VTLLDAEMPDSVSPSEYLRDNFSPSDRIAILVLNRTRRETTQRITSAEKAGSSGFQAWLKYKNANGSDIYVGMNPLKNNASTRTKDDIQTIRHLYIDLDHAATTALEEIEGSSLVPRPNYVLNTSEGKYQVVWKVEDISLTDAEGLQRAMVNEFGGDPAATDSTRVLRLPGFANKKYNENFYVRARIESTQTYHFPDFRLQIDAQDSPRHQLQDIEHGYSQRRTGLSQSERDWAYAKRALARGDDPEEIIRRIADYRAADKHDPEYYARHTVTNTHLAQRPRDAATTSPEESTAPRERE